MYFPDDAYQAFRDSQFKGNEWFRPYLLMVARLPAFWLLHNRHPAIFDKNSRNRQIIEDISQVIVYYTGQADASRQPLFGQDRSHKKLLLAILELYDEHPVDRTMNSTPHLILDRQLGEMREVGADFDIPTALNLMCSAGVLVVEPGYELL
jgi:hypothetical protein